jgi:hypothetical protein
MVSSVDGVHAGALVWAATVNTVPLMTIMCSAVAMHFMLRFTPSDRSRDNAKIDLSPHRVISDSCVRICGIVRPTGDERRRRKSSREPFLAIEEMFDRPGRVEKGQK